MERQGIVEDVERRELAQQLRLLKAIVGHSLLVPLQSHEGSGLDLHHLARRRHLLRDAGGDRKEQISSGLTIPFSVIIPVMYFPGVTSKAGLRAFIPVGVRYTFVSLPPCSLPVIVSTSSTFLSSIGISSPLGHSQSIVEVGAAT